MDSSSQGLVRTEPYYDSPKLARAPSLKERLQLEVEQCEIRLAEAKRALAS